VMVKAFAIVLALALFYSVDGFSAAYEIATGYWAPTWMDPPWVHDCRRSGRPCPCLTCGGGAPG